MRILVTVCGIGLGHATRIVSILNKLRKENEIKVVASGLAYDYLHKADYPTEEIMSVEFRGQNFTMNTFSTLVENIDLPANFTRNYFLLSDIIEEFGPDVVLCDSEPTSFVISKMKGLKLVVLSNLFSAMEEAELLSGELMNRETRSQMSILQRLLNTVMKQADLITNPTFVKRRSLSSKLKFTGLIVRKEPDELKSDYYLKKKLGKEFYLVSFGGSSFGSSLFNDLSKVLQDFEDKNFVVSSGFRIKTKKKVKNLTIMPFIDNYLEYLKVCKGIISTAGHSTLSESLVYRKPCMVVPIRNHIEQMANAHVFDRVGIGKACFMKGRDHAKFLKRGLKHFFEHEEDYRKKIRGMKIDSNGAEETASLITSL